MKLDRRTLWLLIAFGVMLRLWLLATTVGTNDIGFHILWARIIREHGIPGAYVPMWELNHPPLALFLFAGLDRAARATGIEYANLFRLVQVGGDLLTTFCLWNIANRLRIGYELPALFVVCPVAIFISGFHGNTDPTMIALLVASLALFVHERFFWAGVLFAFSIGIKIVPLLVLPAVVLAARRGRWKFLGGFSPVAAATFLPPLVILGPLFLRNVFGYSGFAGKWGFPALALWVEGLVTAPRTTVLYRMAILYADHGRYLVILGIVGITAFYAWRFRGDSTALLRSVPVLFLTTLFFAPGFGVQYLLWPMPFLPLALGRRTYAVVMLATSAYLFITYTIWSRGFPWWYADSIARTPGKPALVPLGLVVWLIFGVAIASALRRPAQSFVNARPLPPRAEDQNTD